MKTARSGYLAITTAIIISLVMLLVASVLGSSSLFSRFSDLDSLSKKESYYLARSCVDYALLKMAVGTYSGNETVLIGSQQCTILPIETSGNNKIVKAKGQSAVGGVTTNLKVTINSLDLSTVSSEEVRNF